MRLAMFAFSLCGVVAACGSRPPAQAPPPSPPVAAHARRAECTLVATGCHDVDDCGGRGLCEAAPATSDYGCGIPPTHVESCKADADCTSREVCNSFRLGCNLGHRCEPRCEMRDCVDGWACRASGRCTARLCPDEWSCGDYGECKQPKAGEGILSGGRDVHGCMPLPCARDVDCPCAHCVKSRCTPIPGRCIEPRG